MRPSQYPGFRAEPFLVASKKAAVNATATYATIHSAAIPTGTVLLRVLNESDTTLRFNTGAAADANSAGIPTNQWRDFWGDETQLGLIQFYTGSSTKNVSFECYKM
jgi:hypothetical protein